MAITINKIDLDFIQPAKLRKIECKEKKITFFRIFAEME